MVGAVVVADDAIVGEGSHGGPGLPHAEVLALDRAGERARGATLFTSLEPCDHYGRTPPCTDAIVRAGIARVVSAARDPNPVVDGQGVRSLRAHGVEVLEGILEAEAQRLNAGVRQARPHRDAVRDLEGRRVAGRQGGGARRLLAVDHRRRGAGRRASPPSVGGRDRGGCGHGDRRQPRAHGP
jgi:pyrimidine deaminase RibD-like protein